MPETALKIARDFSLPTNAVTEVISVLATRGAGKSFGSAAFIEELYAAALQFVVIDPMGVYWGLRSSYDGKKAGLKIIVLGGEQGDVPLEPTSGRLIADVVVDSGQSFVIDLSLFNSKAEQVRFMEAFCERLFYRKGPVEKRTPLMLVVDEADEFAPQKPEKDETKMLAHMIRLAKRGRTRGIGLYSLTQRAAEFSKAILNLSSAVLFMRTAGPHDRREIKKWMAGSAPDLIALVDGAFPKLDTGHALVYSPHWLRLEQPREMKFRMIRTFDSYKTPEPGEARAAPQAVAKIDLEALGAEIAATVERAKENDPAELHKTIRDLRKQLAERPAGEPDHAEIVRALRAEKLPELPEGFEWDTGGWMGPTPQAPLPRIIAPDPERVDVPVLTAQQLLDATLMVNEGSAAVKRLVEEIVPALASALAPVAAGINKIVEDVPSRGTAVIRGKTRPAVKRQPPEGAAALALPRPALPHRSEPGGASTSQNGAVPRPQQKILDALAWYEALGVPAATRVQVALIAGYSHTSGGYQNLLSKLRTSGHVEYATAGTVTLTDAGRALSADPGLPTTNEGVQAEVLRRLPNPQAKILVELIEAHPNALTREEIAQRTGYSATSGGFQNLLSKLRTAALIEYPDRGSCVALDVLFPMG